MSRKHFAYLLITASKVRKETTGGKMRKVRRNLLLISLAILIFLIGCSNNSPTNFVTTFEYPKSGLVPIAQSAKTIDEQTGKLVAEAELIGFSSNSTLIVKEAHYKYYGPIKIVIFSCKSEFRMDGIKIRETEIKGRKVFEVYHMWPTFSRF